MGLGCSEGTAADEVGDECSFGEGVMCNCPDGSQSVAWCRLDGFGYGPCECGEGNESLGDEGGETSSTGDGEGETTDEGDSTSDGASEATDDSTETSDEGDSSETSEGGETGDPSGDQVCYLGPDEDYSVCFPLVMPALPAGYEYPAPYMGNPNYRSPIRYLDLEAIDQSAAIAPNFTLDELAQVYKGRYAVVQPHAVERLQLLRDMLGPISVNSGYRPPGYNAMIGGATYSRHMYGDGFDLDPVDVSLATLESACTDNGGFLVEYEAHVHCDWRDTAVDVGFFGVPDVEVPVPIDSVLAATLVHDPVHDTWLAPAQGFDEGEPARRWTAFAANDDVLAEARGRSFSPPPGTARIEVIVGARIFLAHAL